MAYSEAQKRATMKYQKENYDTLTIRMIKGKKEQIREHAESQGEKLTPFIMRAIEETMKRDKSK